VRHLTKNIFRIKLDSVFLHKREFVVKDCDGRLLAFGANL
jgi:hypothetical protein